MRSRFLLAAAAAVTAVLGLAACQGPHPYRTAPPTTLTVPQGGSAGGATASSTLPPYASGGGQ